MTAIWFTSDLHISHRLVAGLRGFDDVEAHDAQLAANWDTVIRPADQVWVLGDVCGTRGTEAAALEWVSQRPGIKHLIAGNHDGCHPMHHEAHKMQRMFLKVFASVQQSAVRKTNGERVLLSHFPYDVDHASDIRYRTWRFPNHGQWLIHGHTHSDRQITSSRELHVGLDAHDLRPVPLRWIEDRIAEGIQCEERGDFAVGNVPFEDYRFEDTAFFRDLSGTPDYPEVDDTDVIYPSIGTQQVTITGDNHGEINLR